MAASTTNTEIMAATQIATTAITAISNSGSKKAQITALQLQGRLDQLSTQQKYNLALKLQYSTSDDQRIALMQDSISQIDAATVAGNTSILSIATTNQKSDIITTGVIIAGSVVLLLFAVYFINKKM